jgi:hypothetical protein
VLRLGVTIAPLAKTGDLFRGFEKIRPSFSDTRQFSLALMDCANSLKLGREISRRSEWWTQRILAMDLALSPASSLRRLRSQEVLRASVALILA